MSSAFDSVYSDYIDDCIANDSAADEAAPYYAVAERIAEQLDSLPDSRVVRRHAVKARAAAADLYVEDSDGEGSWTELAWGDWGDFNEAERTVRTLLNSLTVSRPSRLERRQELLARRIHSGLNADGRKATVDHAEPPGRMITASPCLTNGPPPAFEAPLSAGELEMVA